MKHIKKFKIFENSNVSHISDLKVGDTIAYQGSRFEVIKEDDFAVKVKSIQTGDEFLINQGQLEQYGIKLV